MSARCAFCWEAFEPLPRQRVCKGCMRHAAAIDAHHKARTALGAAYALVEGSRLTDEELPSIGARSALRKATEALEAIAKREGRAQASRRRYHGWTP